MHNRQRSFKKPNPKFNLFYLEPSEHYFFRIRVQYLTEKSAAPYSPQNKAISQHRVPGDLHFSTHSCSWDPASVRSPVLRLPFCEGFVYSAHKLSDLLQRNPALGSLPAGLAPERMALSVRCTALEVFPRAPFSAKEKISVCCCQCARER